MEASCFDHSCRPNAERRFYGTKMQVYALTTIDTEKEEVLVSYERDYRRYKCRQEILKSEYNFECHCIRCNVKNRKKDDKLLDKFYRRGMKLEKMFNTHVTAGQVLDNFKDQLDIWEALFGKYSDKGTEILCAAV